MEFSANVGKLNIRKLTQGHCPLIVELRGGQKAVLTKINSKKDYQIYDSENEQKYSTYSYREFK